MRTQDTRDILYFDCQIVSDPENYPKKSMEWLAERISALPQEETIYWSRDKKKKVFLRKKAISDGLFWLLLYSNDADGSDASFAHLETDDQRDEAKRDGEGRPESAHLAIGLENLPGRQFRFLVLLEEASTLPRSRVERYLNFLLRRVHKHNPEHFKHQALTGERDAEGRPRLVKYKNKVQLLGHLSDDFRKDVEAGRLLGISLETDNKEMIGFGEGSYLIPVQKQIKLSPKGTWKEAVEETVKDALKIGRRHGLERARIVFSSEDKSSHTAILDTETGTVLNDGYVKRFRFLTKGAILKEAHTEISPVMKNRMETLLKSHIDDLRE